MNAALWAELWIVLGLVGPLSAGIMSLAGQRASGALLRAEVLLASLGLVAMGWMISQNALVPGIVSLPTPFPPLHVSPLPMADLWSILSGVLLGATWLLIRKTSTETRILWALVPMSSSMGFFLLAGGGLSLLLGLEAISLSSYLGLVTTRRSRKLWNAGWVLLILSEMGGLLLLLAMGLIMVHHGASLSFVTDNFRVLAQEASHMSSSIKLVIMVLVLLAFGVKAGLFPVMIWMPLAEPEAPGPVAGLFSGVFTALAVLGILAVENVVHPGIGWGIILLILGTTGAFVAALYSIVSRHVKQILAYSTLEILGLVFSALGIWNIAQRANAHSLVSTLAWDAAMILLIMHAGAKFVLFSITEETEPIAHTIDGLGGIAHDRPKLSLAAAVAVGTLAAVPPLGGFVGEWLLLESVLKPLGTTLALRNIHLLFLLAGIFLALASAVGVGTYIRWFGFVFLGPKRRALRLDKTQKLRPTQVVGYIIALLPVLIAGPGVPWLIPWLNLQGSQIFGNNNQYVIAPLLVHPKAVPLLVHIGGDLVKTPGAPGTIFFPQGFSVGDPYVLLLMGIVLAGIVALIRHLLRKGQVVRLVEPWTGGTSDYNAQKSFTAEGFVHPLRLAFQGFFGLKRQRYDKGGVRFYRHTIIYRLEEQGYLPLLKLVRYIAGQVRKTQSGSTPAYLSWLFYGAMVATLLALWHPLS
ncbi:proton-conducting transporter membrane subunit [Sulfobacillus thermosulfidooxidans]|uniref:proton-conducting transporter transmembrane domain-containing protein n=1 Tax=Sulfobacillus thermosulfidooxidans TaxID=28034 RepID=UPI0006B51EE4|nr:proton-conducting transporter membrane subunit [Sulfobacillus thermosulfidooxidans]